MASTLPSRARIFGNAIGVWQVAVAMTVVIFAALLYNNREYLFATSLFEHSDWAANSLLVREAKRSFLLHGHYSQYHFYHPGPILIDTLAAGEAIFYDALHWVPTPYNGQLIALCLLMTLVFSLALSICAEQLGNRGGGSLFFLPLAVLLAVWHYGTVGVQVFLDAWPAFPLIGMFLCFVVTAAAVAAGRGQYLPLLAATGGWLVHNHVAQTLFAVPLALLAYGGLLAACRRRGAGASIVPAGWRAFPRAHQVAAVVLLAFILPLVLDGWRGRESNLADILRSFLGRRESGQGMIPSFFYLISFGGYDTFRPGHRVFEYRGMARMLDYVTLHWRAYALWSAALVATPVLSFCTPSPPARKYRGG